MELIINKEVPQEDALGVIVYLMRHGMAVMGRRAFCNHHGEIGKYLLHPMNLNNLTITNFSNEKFYVELPVEHEWLDQIHHTVPQEDETELEINNYAHYDCSLSLAEDKVLVKLTNQNWRELAEFISFEEETLNIFANDKYREHYNNYYQEEVEDE